MIHVSPPPLDLLRRIDQISDRFESAWNTGAALRLEGLLEEFPEHEQAAVLRELLPLEIELTRRHGSSESSTNYRSRFARHVRVVDEVLSKVGPSESTPWASPEIIASRYQATRLHAEGGLGLIYSADDLELYRTVALKEIKEEFATISIHRDQFLFEARVTGALEHPGIVPVHGLGAYSDGRPYYAMRLIRGVSLKTAVQWHIQKPESTNAPAHEESNALLEAMLPSDRGLSFRELISRFCDVCNTLAYAHSRGVLHRDLKPDNIMLGKYGETFVVDWGLAALVDLPLEQPYEESLLRARLSGSGKSGSVVGTPGYMSPEQASGAERLTAATDVYGLGATLYFLLTGQPPVSSSGKLTEVLERVRSSRFPPPNKVRTNVPAALNAVCLKALSLEPKYRYSSALELKRDLQCWLADEPVTVYREPWSTRARRWAKRHKTLVTTATVSATLLLAVWGVWHSWNAHRIQGLSLAAKSALRDAVSALQQNQFQAVRENLETAKARVRSDSALADLLPAVMATEAQYRLMVTTDAEDQLRRAEESVRASKFTEAAALFAHLRASLEGDDMFSELQQRARRGEEQAQAQEKADFRWRQFRRLAEKARFFGSYVGGGSKTESALRALQAAEEALVIYDLSDESAVNDLRSRSRETSVRTTSEVRTLTSSATSERHEELRSLTFELLLIRAETQVLVNQEESKRTEILEDSLRLLTQAERLLAPQTSRLVWSQRAAYLRQLGKLIESQTAAKVAEGTAPLSALEFFLAGESARRVDRDFAQAEAHYLEALHRNSRDHWVHFALGACRLERMRDAESVDRVDRQTKGGDDEHVENVLHDGTLAAAIHALTSSLALAPDFPWPLVLRGYVYAEMNDFVRAEQDFADAEAIRQNKQESDLVFDSTLLRSAVMVNRAALRIRQAEHASDEARRNDYYERAVAELQAALQDNELVQARFNLGLVLSRLKRHAEARDAWTAALNQSDAREPLLRAEILQRRGDGTLEPAPNDPQFVMLARKDFREALLILDQISSGSANSRASRQRGQLRERLGRSYLRTQEWSLALAQFDAALREADVSPNLHRFRGQCLMALNRHAEALVAYSDYAKQTFEPSAQRREKPDVSALRTLGMLSLQSGAWRESLSALTSSMDSELDGKIATKRGWLLTTSLWPIVLDDFDRAIAWHHTRGEEDWEAYAGRAFARAKLGQQEAAIDDIEKAIRLGLQQIDAEPPPINPQQQKGILFFNAACTYAVAVRQIRLSQPPDFDREIGLQKFTNRAIELLRLSQKQLDPQEFAAALSDDSLDPVRESQEFLRIVKELSPIP